MKSIIDLSKNISSILNLDDLLEQAIQVTGAQRGYLMLNNEETNELEIKVIKNIHKNESFIENYSKVIAHEVYSKGIEVLTTNAGEDERFQKLESVIHYDLKSIICIPLKHKDTIIGICYLDNPLSSAVFSDEDLEIINILMSQVAISIENARLYKLAITDGLTKIYNHRHFKLLLQKEIDRATRYEHNFSLIMIDVDHFKHFNDTYGHQIGDRVLTRVTEVMQRICRKTDIIARCGSEEFVVILPETIIEKAAGVAEKIRKTISEESMLKYKNKNLHVAISLGISAFPLFASSADELIETADIALYVSKKTGRNRATLYNNNLDPIEKKS